MNRLLLPVAALCAAVLLGFVGWLILRETPAAPEPPPPVRREPPRTTGGAPQFPPPIPEEAPPGEAPPGEAEEPPLPPDAYPWEVPGWWFEIDRKFREKEIVIEGEEVKAVARYLEFVSIEVGFPVRVGPELAKWSEDFNLAVPSTHAPARAFLEALATRSNLELVLTADAVLLHQRGKAPDERLVRAGRVQTAVLEAEERHRGTRPPDATTEGLAASPIRMGFRDTPLREAARRLGEILDVPVYLDRPLWNVNPLVNLPEDDRDLGALLGALVAPWEGAWDLTARRVVLFRPVR